MSIAVAEDSVWVGNEGDGTVARIDPASNEVVATIPIGQRGSLRLAAGEGRVWVAACVDVPDPWHLTTANGALWVTTNSPDGIVALDPVSGDIVRRIAWGVAPYAIASGP